MYSKITFQIGQIKCWVHLPISKISQLMFCFPSYFDSDDQNKESVTSKNKFKKLKKYVDHWESVEYVSLLIIIIFKSLDDPLGVSTGATNCNKANECAGACTTTYTLIWLHWHIEFIKNFYIIFSFLFFCFS